jgi:predicted kinase
VEIFDCIEFDPALRRCDLAAEIAFLLMDLEVRNGAAYATQFLEGYLEIVKDPEQTKLLDFYKCYRALVRAKVYALRGEQGFSQAEKYSRYAERFLWRHTVLVVVCGLTGSGKSTLARELGSSLGWPVFNSDVIRKQMTGVTGRHSAAVDESIYSPLMTGKTYAKLLREAEKAIAKSGGAILDATFARREQRESVLRLSRKHNLPVFFIHCEASAEITRARLAQRNAVGRDISDGRWIVYEKQHASADAMNDIPEFMRLELNTDAPLGELVTRCKKFLRSRTGPTRAS